MEDLIYLKVGTLAMIVTLKGTVYKGTVTNVDIEEETVTIENYNKFEYGLSGYVETYCIGETTIKNTEVLTCICTDPLWDIVTGLNIQ